MKSRFSKWIVFLIILVVGAVAASIILQRHFHAHDTVAVVQVTPVVAKPMPVLITLPATVASLKTVAIQSQVTGTILKIDFTPGDVVQAGQDLFEIDPANFQAQLQESEANLAQDQAQLVALTADLDRYTALHQKAFISTQDFDQMQANYLTQKAKVAADQQAIAQANISLGYTKITAPIAGKTGDSSIKVGDLVVAASGTPLVTSNQRTPIEINFYLPQTELAQVLQFQKQKPLTVEAWSEDLSKKLAQGCLTFVDNQVNAETGTVLLKAQVDNTQAIFWPGQMVVAKIVVTVQQDALVIPARAVQTDQQGNFVYVLTNNQAHVQRIMVDRQMDDLSIIKEGLKAGDQILSVFPPNLKDNDPVRLQAPVSVQ